MLLNIIFAAATNVDLAVVVLVVVLFTDQLGQIYWSIQEM